jgi:trehalose-phosphatase
MARCTSRLDNVSVHGRGFATVEVACITPVANDPFMVPDVLAAIDARPTRERLVVLSDFDGTLAHFDVDPAAPQLSADTRRVLETLAARDDITVGLVSGRRLDDLAQRTRLSSRVYLAGLHGLEIRHGDVAWHHPDLHESREDADRLCKALLDTIGHLPGVKLEHKGVAVTVHVRGVATALREEAMMAARDAVQPWLDARAFKRLDGDLAMELLPDIPWTKGDAVRWIVADVEAVVRQPAWCVFFGDDVTDEDAFRAIARGLTVVVGRRPSRAQLRLDSPDDVAAVLASVYGNGHERSIGDDVD